MPYANVASTCAIPINPIMSSGETIMRDLDLVNPTVMRSMQSSVSSVGEPSGKNRPLRKPVLGCATIATAAVPPAELAMVSTRSVLGIFFLGRAVEIVLVVRGCCHHEKTIRKSSEWRNFLTHRTPMYPCQQPQAH